jgi:hypothetical protein
MFGIADTPTLDLMMAPYNVDSTGLLILSDVYYDPVTGFPTVEWRYCASRMMEGSTPAASSMGIVNAGGVISGVSKKNEMVNGVNVNGQTPMPGAGPYFKGGSYSKFGPVGGPANLSSVPALATTGAFNPGDEIVVAEMYYGYQPITNNSITNSMIGSQVVYTSAISVPRYGLLAGLLVSDSGTDADSNGADHFTTVASNCP